jgi:uncharacterized protein
MTLFEINKPVIGMIHLQALPGTPANNRSPKEIIDIALKEAKQLVQNNIDAIAIENMHDTPYLKNTIGPEIVSLMAIIAYEIKKEYKIPVGIQVLAGANNEALAIALNSGIDFIRAEGFVYAHIADEGYIESCAGELLRYRKMIGADHIKIFADIKKKHSSHLITADVDIVETAKTAEFFNADGIIITGSFTGANPHEMDVNSVKKDTKLPVIIGSGIDIENIENYFSIADAFFVGSYFKKGNFWKNGIDENKVLEFMEKLNHLRN